MMLTNTTRWSHPPDNQVVPSPWQATQRAGSTSTQRMVAASSGVQIGSDGALDEQVGHGSVTHAVPPLLFPAPAQFTCPSSISDAPGPFVVMSRGGSFAGPSPALPSWPESNPSRPQAASSTRNDNFLVTTSS